MYEISRLGTGALNAAYLVAQATSPIVAVAGAVAAVAFAACAIADRFRRRAAANNADAQEAGTGWLLAAPVVLVLMQFVALAAGKPGEYGRFAVLPDVALAIAAVVAVGKISRRPWTQVASYAILILATAWPGYRYLHGFVEDSRMVTSRLEAARQIERYRPLGARSLGLLADPAPYGMPPVDLFRWKILLLPLRHDRDDLAGVDLLVRAGDTPTFNVDPEGISEISRPEAPRQTGTRPITWADKSFELLVLRENAPGPGAAGP
jgi:hypothetical protein